jgi:transposase-like protein
MSRCVRVQPIRRAACPANESRTGKLGSTWHLDEMFVNLRGRPYALWRVADERGAELDVLLQNCRDKSAVEVSEILCAEVG